MSEHINCIMLDDDMLNFVVIGKIQDKLAGIRDALLMVAQQEKKKTLIVPCFTTFDLLSLNFLFETMFCVHAAYCNIALLMQEHQLLDKEFCRLIENVCYSRSGKARVIQTNQQIGRLSILVKPCKQMVDNQIVITSSRDTDFLKYCAGKSLYTMSVGYRKFFKSTKMTNLECSDERILYGTVSVNPIAYSIKQLISLLNTGLVLNPVSINPLIKSFERGV